MAVRRRFRGPKRWTKNRARRKAAARPVESLYLEPKGVYSGSYRQYRYWLDKLRKGGVL